MAAPNLLNSTQILGKTVIANVTTVLSNVIVNDTNSGNLIKVDTMTISNYTTSPITANVILRRGDAINGYIIGTTLIPSSSTLTVIARDTALLMEETDYIQANVSSNVAAHMTISYEVVT
jgi:hypothetical protein